jgi:hypothetical protein
MVQHNLKNVKNVKAFTFKFLTAGTQLLLSCHDYSV